MRGNNKSYLYTLILPNGSMTMSLGLSNCSHINNDRIEPSAFATSILTVPASVQYSLFVIQSRARPAGDTKIKHNIKLVLA